MGSGNSNIEKEDQESKSASLSERPEKSLTKDDALPLSAYHRRMLSKLHSTLMSEQWDVNKLIVELLTEGCIDDEHKMSVLSHDTTESQKRKLFEIMSNQTRGDMNKFMECVTKHSGQLKERLEGMYYQEKMIFSVNVITRIIQQSTKVTGITVLDGKIFVVLCEQAQVQVYDSTTLKKLSYINIPDMKKPEGMAGCSQNKVLYVSDHEARFIYKVNFIDESLERWGVKEGCWPVGVSVTSELSVLVTVWYVSAVWLGRPRGRSGMLEYTSEAHLIREIELDNSVSYAHQTLELSTDQFIICHGWGSSYHRVCVINSEGQMLKSFGGERGQGENQLNWPLSMSIDKNRKVIFIADFYNNLVVTLDCDLTYLCAMNASEGFKNPSSVYFDCNSDQLIVGEGTLNSARMLVVSPDR